LPRSGAVCDGERPRGNELRHSQLTGLQSAFQRIFSERILDTHHIVVALVLF
jgi:hypothetical protein